MRPDGFKHSGTEPFIAGTVTYSIERWRSRGVQFRNVYVQVNVFNDFICHTRVISQNLLSTEFIAQKVF